MSFFAYMTWILAVNEALSSTVLFRQSFDENENVRCLDGSVASFYNSEIAASTEDILVYLQPGGYCHNPDTCRFRCNLAPFMCTSPTDPIITKNKGILSDDVSKNPVFAHFFKVVIPYCSGDMFVGRREASDATDGYAFLGRTLLASTIRKMRSITDMQSTRRLVLAGSSAGGAGVAFNCDYVASLLPWINVRCVVDGAFFYPVHTQFRTDPDCESIETVLHQGAHLWKAPELLEFLLHGAWWEKIKQPVFISTASIDQFGFQIYCGNLNNRSDLSTWSQGTAHMAQTIDKEHHKVGLFMPSCYDHMMLTDDDMFSKVKVGQQMMSLSETLGAWLMGDKKIHIWDKCDVNSVVCQDDCANQVITYNDMAL